MLFNSLTHSLTVVSSFPSSFIHALVRSLALFLNLSLSFFFFSLFACFFSPLLIHLFACSFTRSLALLFGLPPRSLSSIFPISPLTPSLTHSKLAHSPTYSLICSLSYFMLTRLYFLVLPSSLNNFSIIHWLSFPLIHSLNRSIACLLPPPFTHSLARSVACCLPPYLTLAFIHSLAHKLVCLLACSLPPSLTCFDTSLLDCFHFSSLLYPRTRSLACFVPDSLSYSFAFFSFPLIHLLARLLHFAFTHSLSCLHSLATLLLPLPPSFTHSLAQELTRSLAFFFH